MNALDRLREAYVPEKVIPQSPENMQWFRDAKFGMFIHWGLYALLGRGEWVMFNERLSTSEYAQLAQRFDVPRYDPRAWARTAKAAGMKYMVLTTRHHDGFSLFDSRASSFNAVNSAARRDLVAEYVEACRGEGLKVGFYYSPMDWRYPGYFFPEMYLDSALAMRDQCHAQLEELMTGYGKIDMLWFDGEWLAHGGIQFGNGHKGWYQDENFHQSERYFKVNYFWQSEKMINRIRAWQPGIMLNNRFGWEGDFHVRERNVGGIRTDKPWDNNDCLTRSWGYIPGAPMMSLREVVQHLITVVVRDGTYLLNVGPTGQGDMEPRQVERLAQVGAWLERYGEAVYGTRGGPILPGDWGGACYRGDTVYLHILDWREDTLELEGLTGEIAAVESLNSSQFSVEKTETGLRVSVPIAQRDPIDTILRIRMTAPIRWEGVRAGEQDVYGQADGLQ